MKLKNKLKNKLQNGAIGNEVIGDLGFNREEVIQEEAPKKVKKNKKMKSNLEIPKTEDEVLEIPKSTKKNYAVLDFLGISQEVDLRGLITPQEINDMEFHLIAPTGIDPDEVNDFCERLQRELFNYIDIIKQREIDFKKVLERLDDTEKKLIEKQQESELANFIIDSKSNEEKLKEELLELRLENNELKSKLKLVEQQKTQQTKQMPTLQQEEITEFPKDDFDEMLDSLDD